MGVSLYNNSNRAPTPQEGMSEYLEYVYRMHKGRDSYQAIELMNYMFAPAFVDNWMAYVTSIFGDVSHLSNTKPQNVQVDISPILIENKVYKPGEVNYKNLTASIIANSREHNCAVILTPSFANDEYIIVGMYTKANYTDTTLFTKNTYSEIEIIMTANKVVSPPIIKSFFDFLHTGIMPVDFGDSQFGIH